MNLDFLEGEGPPEPIGLRVKTTTFFVHRKGSAVF